MSLTLALMSPAELLGWGFLLGGLAVYTVLSCAMRTCTCEVEPEP